jgi:WD40 repeat protein
MPSMVSVGGAVLHGSIESSNGMSEKIRCCSFVPMSHTLTFPSSEPVAIVLLRHGTIACMSPIMWHQVSVARLFVLSVCACACACAPHTVDHILVHNCSTLLNLIANVQIVHKCFSPLAHCKVCCLQCQPNNNTIQAMVLVVTHRVHSSCASLTTSRCKQYIHRSSIVK